MLHRNAAPGDIHPFVNWVVANAAARLALTVVAADLHKVAYQTDTGKYHVLTSLTGPTWYLLNPDFTAVPFSFIVACSDEVTALTVGTNKVVFRMPRNMTLTRAKASLTVPQASGTIFTVDIKYGGATIFSGAKLTIDNTEPSSTTAATAAPLSITNLIDDIEINIDITQIGNGTAKGLKITFDGAASL